MVFWLNETGSVACTTKGSFQSYFEGQVKRH
jgi:hypothetical protein